MVAPVPITQSVVALKVPISAELAVGALAVNMTDCALYTQRPDGTVVRVEGDSGNGTLASASTLNLGAVMGAVVDVTGTTTINTITLRDGQTRTVRFTGALVLVNSAGLLLPRGANITTAAGDFAVFRGYASGVVRCVNYSYYADVISPATQSAINAKANSALPGWTAPTLLNSWVDFGSGTNPAGFYKDNFGIVRLRGLIKSGTFGSAAFVLPAGYSPANAEYIATVSDSAFGFVIIDNSGNVKPWVGSNNWFSLDGLTFRPA